jgi:hypothetical protein
VSDVYHVIKATLRYSGVYAPEGAQQHQLYLVQAPPTF